MRRREFITALGGAALWPLAGRAQQSTMPVIGVLGDEPESDKIFLDGLRKGLSEGGYVEGQNLAIDIDRRKDGMIGCPLWLPSWCAGEWPFSSSAVLPQRPL